jgi:hypothetical protein
MVITVASVVAVSAIITVIMTVPVIIRAIPIIRAYHDGRPVIATIVPAIRRRVIGRCGSGRWGRIRRIRRWRDRHAGNGYRWQRKTEGKMHSSVRGGDGPER